MTTPAPRAPGNNGFETESRQETSSGRRRGCRRVAEPRAGVARVAGGRRRARAGGTGKDGRGGSIPAGRGGGQPAERQPAVRAARRPARPALDDAAAEGPGRTEAKGGKGTMNTTPMKPGREAKADPFEPHIKAGRIV